MILKAGQPFQIKTLKRPTANDCLNKGMDYKSKNTKSWDADPNNQSESFWKQ